ncbi:unnamed protein product, partial [Meganyctiphanes norvegica]
AKNFLASYMTTTYTSLSTLTSVIPYTCYAATVPATACGARKRRALKIKSITDFDLESNLGSSLLEGTQEDAIEGDRSSAAASEKVFFTVWQSSTTSLTFTSYSTNRSFTVSILRLCTVAGQAYNLC